MQTMNANRPQNTKKMSSEETSKEMNMVSSKMTFCKFFLNSKVYKYKQNKKKYK